MLAMLALALYSTEMYVLTNKSFSEEEEKG